MNLSAQEGTSSEEYRYLSKGYGYQIEMGLDAQKEGYQLKEVWKNEKEGVTIVGMFSENEKAPRALVAAFNKANTNSKPIYICIPNAASSKDILNQYNLVKESEIGFENRRKLDDSLRRMLFENLGTEQNAPQVVSTIPISYEMPHQPRLVAKGINTKPKVDTLSSTLKVISPRKEKAANQGFVNPTLSYELAPRNVEDWPAFKKVIGTRGMVNIKVCVDKTGSVSSAKFTQKGSTILNTELINLIVENAKEIQFEEAEEVNQCGTVLYKLNF